MSREQFFRGLFDLRQEEMLFNKVRSRGLELPWIAPLVPETKGTGGDSGKSVVLPLHPNEVKVGA